jgi:chitin disaccharide deacetylase
VSGHFTLVADDYGMTAGVSRGILRLMENGRLSGTGAMTTMPAWKGFHGAFRGFVGKRQLGLHVNLTLGAPLSVMPSLAPGGTLPLIGDLIKRSLSFRIPRDEIRKEIAAQLSAFESAIDQPPDFVDGHQHCHALPGIRAALLDVLRERYPGTARPWLRDPADSPAAIMARQLQTGKAMAVAALAAGFGASARRAGFRTNSGFAGFSAFDPSGDYAADFTTYLMRPGPDHLVMCHPGEVDAELSALDPAIESRAAELAFLQGPHFLELLLQTGLALRLSRNA